MSALDTLAPLIVQNLRLAQLLLGVDDPTRRAQVSAMIDTIIDVIESTEGDNT